MPDASLPRNSFDRGYTMKYNFSAGMLLPTFVQFCVGGSKVKINMKNFIRSAAVNTSAFTSVSYFTDFYYVPIRQLFSQFGQFKTRTNDIHSSLFSSVAQRMPSISYSVLRELLTDTNAQGLPYLDQLGFDMTRGRNRLGDLLCYGFSDTPSIPVPTDDRISGNIAPLAACAYQKVYFDHYRNTSYEANDVEAYNLDKYYNVSGQLIPKDAARKILTMRYVNYRKDFFGNIYPSLNYIASSAGGFQSDWVIPSSVVGYSGILGNSSYNVINNSDSAAISQSSVVQNDEVSYTQNQFSVQTLRAAFALDKLVRASSYAPQHVKDQYAARYGFTPKGYSMDESYRIGSFKSEIVFGEVTSTSDTEPTGGASLGQIGGKGVGGSDWQKVISHQCKDDCIIIGVSYAIPRISYDALMIDKFAQKFVPTDYFQPEFMNLGLQPVLRKEYSSLDDPSSNDIMGYTPRYSEYKINIDKNHGLFKDNLSLSPFTMHGRLAGYDPQGNGLTAAWFKCNPSDLDSIFAESFNGYQVTDQFYGILEFAFGCVAPMSVHGIPSL